MASPPVLLVAAHGGHLAHLWPRRPWWHGHERFWITVRTTDPVRGLTDPAPRPARRRAGRHFATGLRNTPTALRLFVRHRPTVVVADESGGTLPFLVLARLLRVPTLPVEIHDRITTPTRTALLCRPRVDPLLVRRTRPAPPSTDHSPPPR